MTTETSPTRRSSSAALALALGVGLLASTGTSLGPTGCLGACDEAACQAGFEVRIDGGVLPGQRFQSATYVFRAEADGSTFEMSCTFDDLGRGECVQGTWITPPTDGLEAWSTSVQNEDPSRGVTIVLHFVRTTEARHGRNQLGPDMVEITVLRDGTEATRATFAPDYMVFEDFNGQGCGDCEFAQTEIHVESP